MNETLGNKLELDRESKPGLDGRQIRLEWATVEVARAVSVVTAGVR